MQQNAEQQYSTLLNLDANETQRVDDNQAHLPRIFVGTVIVVSCLPILLTLLGVDLGAPPASAAPSGADAKFHVLHGPFVHTLLEWTASAIAVFTVLLAFVQYAVRKDVVVPVLGMALLCAGCMDAFHTLAADRLVSGAAPNTSLIPFTWALSRTFNAVIMIVGMMLLLLIKRDVKQNPWFLWAVGVGLLGTSYLLIVASAKAPNLPQTTFPGSFITRPYDVLPLLLFLGAGFLIYVPFWRKNPGLFSEALLLSVLPEVATEAHMAFGSTALFDHHFVVGHALKIVAYAVPLMGLMLEYVHTYRADLALKNHAANLAEDKQQLYKRNAVELERHAAELEEASRYKSQFIANLSHELRTPLNSMLILSQVLSENDEGNLTDEQVKSADIIHSGGEDLLRLLNDILDLSKVEAGMMNMMPETVSLPRLMNQLGVTFVKTAEKKNILFRTLQTLDDSLFFATDALRLEQVLRNLISNALKFTSEGVVTLKTRKPTFAECALLQEEDASCGSVEPRDWICFVVNDTGVGIPAEKLDTIFESFRQADGSVSRAFGGTGLGLAISRHMTKLLGGVIRVESEVEVGSTFTLMLPLNNFDLAAPKKNSAPLQKNTKALKKASRVEAPALPKPEQQEKRSPKKTRDFSSVQWAENDDSEAKNKSDEGICSDASKVLVVEDDPTFSSILKNLLETHGHEAVIVTTGKEALQAARMFSLSGVLLDLGLPDMDGWDVLWELKCLEQTRHIPVYIVSGKDGLDEARKRGALGAVQKPATPGQIEKAMEHLHRLSADSVRHLLLVGDEMPSKSSLASLLGASVEKHQEECAEDALAYLDEHIVDCVVFDANLPDMAPADFVEAAWKTEVGDALLPLVCFSSGIERQDLVSMSGLGVVFVDESDSNHLFEHLSLFLHVRRNLLQGKSIEESQALVDGTESQLAGKKVLLVDDDMRNTFALSIELKKRGMQVILADDGKLALARLKEHLDIDIVLMDVMMPVMDGLTATRELRKDERLRKLPVIALTAKVLSEARLECLDAGCTDYLIKPVDLKRLFRVMSTWLGLPKSSDLDESDEPEPLVGAK
ncbi:MAG: response regulator [Deltaproteobacteria bacterium]|nr:response regulator [Deltaproteobacteria bacterium]